MARSLYVEPACFARCALTMYIFHRQRVSAHSRLAQFHSSRLLQGVCHVLLRTRRAADGPPAETVKVPQMAESISEGTLKSWSKQVGDSVAADEEIATIETDKIDVTVNAPMAGKIVELLASEEDTVTVGQDLFRIEPGEGGECAGVVERSGPEC